MATLIMKKKKDELIKRKLIKMNAKTEYDKLKKSVNIDDDMKERMKILFK